MKKAWWCLSAVVAVIVLASGCHNGGRAQNSTDLRVMNAVIDAETLDLLVDDNVRASALAVGTTSSYSEFDSGTRDVKIRSATLGTVLVEKSVAFASANQTLILYGKRNAIATTLLTDDVASPSSGKLKLRVVGLSPDAGAVDVYVAAGEIDGVPPTISSVTYTGLTDYTEIAGGSYRLVFTTASTKEILFQSAARDLSSGAKLTVAIFPSAGGKLLNAVLLAAGDSAAATFLPNPLGRLKAVNAIPDSPNLNFRADGTALLSNVPFTGTSSYVTAAAGMRALQVEASNVPGQAVAALSKTIDPARDYSIVAANPFSQAEIVALADDNTLPASGFARLRFANMMVDSSVVDVLVNFAATTSALPYRSASGYYSLAGGTTYTIIFATQGGISVLATLPAAELDASGVYTAYLFGNPLSAQARLVRDR